MPNSKVSPFFSAFLIWLRNLDLKLDNSISLDSGRGKSIRTFLFSNWVLSKGDCSIPLISNFLPVTFRICAARSACMSFNTLSLSAKP